MRKWLLVSLFFATPALGAFTKGLAPLDLVQATATRWQWASSVALSLYSRRPGDWFEASFEVIRMESRLHDMTSHASNRVRYYRSIKQLQNDIAYLRFQILNSSFYALDAGLISLSTIEEVLSQMQKPFRPDEQKKITELIHLFPDQSNQLRTILSRGCNGLHTSQ